MNYIKPITIRLTPKDLRDCMEIASISVEGLINEEDQIERNKLQLEVYYEKIAEKAVEKIDKIFGSHSAKKISQIKLKSETEEGKLFWRFKEGRKSRSGEEYKVNFVYYNDVDKDQKLKVFVCPAIKVSKLDKLDAKPDEDGYWEIHFATINLYLNKINEQISFLL